MLTNNDLVLAESALRGQTVLTVYVNGEERDPSKRQQWRVELRHALDDIDRWLLGSSHAERESFAACRSLAEERLKDFTGTVRAPGWVGFFTATGEHSSGSLPAATPTMAAWSTGPSLAPYVRVLKESRRSHSFRPSAEAPATILRGLTDPPSNASGAPVFQCRFAADAPGAS
jgi:hypothetical protein